MVVHPGIVLELGVMKDGCVPEDAPALERDFFHICVEKDGIECYCGNHGCLGNYATLAGMDELYKEAAAAKGVDAENSLVAALAKSAPEARPVAKKVAELLAKGIVKFASDNRIAAVEFMYPDKAFVESVRRHVGELSSGAMVFPERGVGSDVLEAAALMAMFNVYGNCFDKYNS